MFVPVLTTNPAIAEKPEDIKKLLDTKKCNRCDLSSADLNRKNLRKAELDSSDLSYANLSYTKLNRADFSRANLTSTNLSYADLSYADLSQADLSYANLSNAAAYENKGKSLLALNKPVEAKQAFEKAAQIYAQKQDTKSLQRVQKITTGL